jgi:hypothetical protein
MVLSVQAAIGKQHRHERKYICVKFGYVAQRTMNLPSCQHKNKNIHSQKDVLKLKTAKIMCCLDSQWPEFN